MNPIERNSTHIEPISTATKAIRAFCLQCVGDSAHEVRLCSAIGCPLYAWRFGKKPDALKSEPTMKQIEARKASADRLRAIRSIEP